MFVNWQQVLAVVFAELNARVLNTFALGICLPAGRDLYVVPRGARVATAPATLVC